MWREALSGRYQSATGVRRPHKAYPRPALDPPEKPKEALSREERMQRAIDVFSKLSPLQQCGLWLFSHIEAEDQNLIWCLIASSSNEGWHYRDAAKRRVPRGGKRNWKDGREKERYHAQIDSRRSVEKQLLRKCWLHWEPVLTQLLFATRKNYAFQSKTYEKVEKSSLPPKNGSPPTLLRVI